MGVYDLQIAQAKKQIAAKGQLVTWQKPAPIITDPNKPWVQAPGAPMAYPVSIAFFKPANGLSAIIQYLKGTDIVQAGTRGIMASVNFIPEATDKVVRSGRTLSIRSITPLQPNEEVIMYSIEFDGN